MSDTQRQIYKIRIETQLQWLLSSPFIKQCIKRLSFQDYEFMIAKIDDLEQIYNLIIRCYSKYHGYFALFGMSNQWKILYKKALQVWLESGRCLIATDTVSNKIIACACYEDICDVFRESFPLTNEFGHGAEMIKATYIYPMTKVIPLLKDLSKDKYGNVFEVHFQCKDDGVKKRFLSFFLTFVVGANLLMNHCGYKYCYGLWHNASNVRMVKSMGANQVIFKHDWTKHVFQDGTKTTVYFNNLKKEKNYNDNMMDKVKAGCYPHHIILNRNHINNGIQIMQNHIQYQSPSKL